ncbi:MAG: vanadium-dependent haloperoxidase [Burkholderiaceae bacterium]
MTVKPWLRLLGASACLVSTALFTSCGGGGGNDSGFFPIGTVTTPSTPAPATGVKIVVTGPNAVSTWNEIAIDTINVAPATSGTAAEQRPIDSVDLATVHLAIYDALVAITGGYQPWAVVPNTALTGETSQPAAVAAAAYGVLKRLYPNRSAQYQAAYDSYVAGIASGAAKVAGLQLGAEVADGILALRGSSTGDDGRSVALSPYVPGTAPGQFRGVNPINRFYPAVKPFGVTSTAQFRVPPPPSLDSELYAANLIETREFGGAVTTQRTDAQLEIARFHTEPPPRFWPRNLRRLAMTDRPLTEQARLLAMLFTVQADATTTCFESKYFYEFWRPQSAIPLADTDGNPATTADTGWTPVVPTPNHPEYPAAHACNAAAIAEAMKAFFGTDRIEFYFDSTVTGTTHNFTTLPGFVDEIRGARIYGGMHFRNSLVQGEALGSNVAKHILDRHFKAR